MKSFLLSPFTPIVFVCLFMGSMFVLSFLMNYDNPAVFYSTAGFLENITYMCYALALCVALYYNRDFRKNRQDYILFLILWGCALLREMGIQHYLTTTDTTAFKLRFFTNPANPLHEKIMAAFLLLMVGSIVLFLLIRYVSKIIRGFFDLNPLYWTICIFGGMGIVSKIADRFPGNYYKATGIHLDPDIALLLSWIEESGEATLPLLFALAFIQHHYLSQRHTFL